LARGISSIAGFYRFWELRRDSPAAANSPCGRRMKRIKRKVDIYHAPHDMRGVFFTRNIEGL
jgi:hypothetical protein